jgi:hypothetical protein
MASRNLLKQQSHKVRHSKTFLFAVVGLRISDGYLPQDLKSGPEAALAALALPALASPGRPIPTLQRDPRELLLTGRRPADR